jgi:hypothetical protein
MRCNFRNMCQLQRFRCVSLVDISKLLRQISLLVRPQSHQPQTCLAHLHHLQIDFPSWPSDICTPMVRIDCVLLVDVDFEELVMRRAFVTLVPITSSAHVLSGNNTTHVFSFSKLASTSQCSVTSTNCPLCCTK